MATNTSGNQRDLSSWDKLLNELSDEDAPPPQKGPKPKRDLSDRKKIVRPSTCTAPNFAHTPAGSEVWPLLTVAVTPATHAVLLVCGCGEARSGEQYD